MCPLNIIDNKAAYEIWYNHMVASIEAYTKLSEALKEVSPSDNSILTIKQQREAARSVLPNSTETKIFFSFNARSLRHLFHLRGSMGADREMRQFVRLIFEKIVKLKVSKTLFSDISVEDDAEDVLKVQYPHV